MKTLIVIVLILVSVSCTVNRYYYPVVKCECEKQNNFTVPHYGLGVPNNQKIDNSKFNVPGIITTPN